MGKDDRTASLSVGEIRTRLEHVVSMLKRACRTLDEIARLAPAEVTDELNEVEGQADLGVTANNLSAFAADLERASSTSVGIRSPQLASTATARPLAPSKSRGVNAKAARDRREK